MNWHYTPYTLLLFLIASVLIMLVLYARQWRHNSETSYFTLLALAGSWWAVTYGLELAATDFSMKLFWARWQYLGIAGTPLAWLLLVLRYTNRETWLTRRAILWLSAIPILTVLVAFSNDWHHWLWRSNSLTADGQFMVNNYGPWFWLYTLVAYSYVVLGSIFLFRAIWRALVKMFQLQAAILFAGILIPWVGNFLYIFNLNPIPHLDLTPFAFAVSNIFLFVGLYRFRLLDIIPVARSTVINSMEDGMIVLDRRRRILDVNQTAQVILNADTTNLVGQPLPVSISQQLPLLLPDTPPGPFVSELSLTQSGAIRDYEARFSLVLDRGQKHRGYLLLLHDITERKRLQRLQADLTSTMVHDLRTPLSAISTTLGWLDRLLADQLEEADREILQVARHSSDQMLLLVTSILDISHIESGQMPINYRHFALKPVADAVLKRYAVIAREKNLTLTNEITAIPPVYADQDLIDRVLQNLIGNAIKFTPPGGHIGIAVRSFVADRSSLTVAVYDDGPGISPELKHTVFQKFQTGNTSGQGSGLGLAFCKLAIEAHGQRIWIESKPHQGATILFTLALGPMPIALSGWPINRETVAEIA